MMSMWFLLYWTLFLPAHRCFAILRDRERSNSPLDIDAVNACVGPYASEITKILQRDAAFEKALKELLYVKPEDTNRRQCVEDYPLVVNVAPGSSATRSFFYGAAFLGVKGYHYGMASINCRVSSGPPQHPGFIKRPRGREFNVRSDSPYSALYWKYFLKCPQARFTWTYIDPKVWYNIRKKMPYPPPLPIEAYGLNISNLDTFSEKDGARFYILLKEFVECTVQKDRYISLNYEKLSPPKQFWSELAQAVDMGISATALEELSRAGYPYMGSKGRYFFKIGDNGMEIQNNVSCIRGMCPRNCASIKPKLKLANATKRRQ